MEQPQARVIIGALIHGGKGMDDAKHLISCAATIVACAWGDDELDPDIPIQVAVIAEGENREAVVEGNIKLGWIPLELQEATISAIEPGSVKTKKELFEPGDDDKPMVILGMGTLPFCLAFLHFWATSSDENGASGWGLTLMRKLAVSDPRSVVWYDSKDGSTTFGDIADMYADIKRSLPADA
jgi:hypothetical protein